MVMSTYPIQNLSRRCCVTERELREGERYYSALFDEAGQFIRKDYAEDAWSGPPQGIVAFWSGRIPASDRPVKPTINDELLLDCFNHLDEAREAEKVNFRYVLALLLMRRKRLKFEDVRRQSGEESLLLRCAKSGRRYEVADPRLSEHEMNAVQDEVFRVLGWD